MRKNDLKIQTTEGYSINADLFTPDEKLDNGKVIQINCAILTPRKFYYSFSTHLAELGYTVICYDYRGVSEVIDKNGDYIKVDISHWGRVDSEAVFSWIKDNLKSSEIILVGHSIGGVLSGFMKSVGEYNKIILIASSSGFWGVMSTFYYKVFCIFLWYFFIPIMSPISKYTGAKKFRLGENIPKKAFIEFSMWCKHKLFLKAYVDAENLFYSNVKNSVYSFGFYGDPIANNESISILNSYFTESSPKHYYFDREALNGIKVGHFGFFRKKNKEKLWLDLLYRAGL